VTRPDIGCGPPRDSAGTSATVTQAKREDDEDSVVPRQRPATSTFAGTLARTDGPAKIRVTIC
jgi:hypothetical protein